MIVFDLRCSQGHHFEAWFRDGAAYEEQRRTGAVTCAICGVSDVEKAPMAPAVSTRGRIDREQVGRAMRTWRKVQNHIEQNFEHVGQGFPEEARKIHHGEAEQRNIYGEATRAEAKALRDEGVAITPLPWLPRHDD